MITPIVRESGAAVYPAAAVPAFNVMVDNPALAPARDALVLSGISKSYGRGANSVRALRDVSLHVPRGSIYGIIGRSGAGKSTLIRCINRLERPDCGTVVLGDLDVTALSERELPAYRRRIGMIFQRFNLLTSRTVAQNVALPLKIAGVGRRERLAKVAPLLELVGLSDKADVFPAKLSGGQQQRVGIARALVTDPELLLSDEATSALDPQTTISILELLRDINRRIGITIVFITHQMEAVREVCGQVAVLDAGSIVEHGDVYRVAVNAQSDVARSLFAGRRADLPDAIARQIASSPFTDGDAVLRLTFGGQNAYEPVISDLSREFDLPVNIVHGSIDTIGGHATGTLIITIPYAGPAAFDTLVTTLARRVSALEVLGYVAVRA